MDKKKGVLNVTVSVLFKIVIFVGAILVKRFLIQYVGNEVNGLNSLYLSIIGFLSVAELGVGTAISFCMYKPIVEGDNAKVSALYILFKKLYLIIGLIIFVAGLIIMPFLKFLAKDYADIDQNLYLTFFLMLVSVVVTYCFSAKTSLINAYKNDYITTTITSLGFVVQYSLQIVVLILTQSFVWYLVCRIVAALFQWAATEFITRRKYKDIISDKQKIDLETKKLVTKNIKAMFMHKIGAVLVNTVDSVIISAFIGVAILGKYSNYITIMVSMTGLLELCFTPLTSVIGHLCVEESEESVYKYYNFFYAFNYVLSVVFFLGYFATIDDFIFIFFGDNLTLAGFVPLVITLNYFIQFMRRATLLFRDASGTFYNDRWKPLIEGVANIVLSLAFLFIGNQISPEMGIIGVIVATILTNLFICHIVEPYVLFKHALKKPVSKFYVKNYLYMGIFAGLLVLMYYIKIPFDSKWIELIVNGFISVGISMVLFGIFFATNKDLRMHVINFIKRKIFKGKSPKFAVETEGVEVSEGIETKEVSLQEEKEISISEEAAEKVEDNKDENKE